MEIKDIQVVQSVMREAFLEEVKRIVREFQDENCYVDVDYKPVISDENRIIYTAMITARSA